MAWVNGGDTGSLLAGLAAVADATGLPDGDSGRGVTDAGAAVRHWLETDGEQCLLVFDDVSDLEVVRPFVPVGGAARVLITSDRPPAADAGTTSRWMCSAPTRRRRSWPGGPARTMRLGRLRLLPHWGTCRWRWRWLRRSWRASSAVGTRGIWTGCRRCRPTFP